MELKFRKTQYKVLSPARSNCTFMELKLQYALTDGRSRRSSNCTFMELKYTRSHKREN